jgi:endonuclease/exonuclease/phosphatase family metal-dependent hydrolase
MRISTWNVQWATPTSTRGRRVTEILAALDAEVIVLTEGCAALLPAGGHVIEGGPDWGYRVEDPTRRKVLMWSTHPWSDVESTEDDSFPPGRFVAGTTRTSFGEVRVLGVCVPWRGAHVANGRRDRRPWEDHIAFLRSLAPRLVNSYRRTVVPGDFNQRIPRTTQPVHVADLLGDALTDFEVPTAMVSGPQLIDHIAHSPDLASAAVPTLIGEVVDGRRLSDHTGVTVELVPSPHP